MANYDVSTALDFVNKLLIVVAGDTITLLAGNTFDTGSSGFLLRNHGGTIPITIRSSAYATFTPGQRVCPGDLPRMPLLRTTATNGQVFTGQTSAGYWTLVGLAMTHTADIVTTLLKFPEFISNYDPTLESELCHHIVIDRCYLFGKPGNATTVNPGIQRGITLDALDSQVTNCYIADMRHSSADSQTIWFQQAKRILIQNNYLEAAGENIMFGGSSTTIEWFVSSDIVVRGNHLRKPDYWNTWHPDFGTVPGAANETVGPGTVSCTGTTCTTTAPHLMSNTPVAFHLRLANGEQRKIMTAGVPDGVTFTIKTPFSSDPVASPWTKLQVWTIKNLFEIKTGQRVLVEGNYLEGSWYSGQDGRAVLFSTLNDNDRCPWHRSDDLTFRENWLKNVIAFAYFSASDPLKDGGSNRTVQTPGPGTISTVGAAATFSVPHGLAVNDLIRLTSGPQIQFTRDIIAIVDDTHATMRASFRTGGSLTAPLVDETNETWEKWTGWESSHNAVVEHNVVEHMAGGAQGYYWNAALPTVPSGATFLPSTGRIPVGPKDIFIRHNTLSHDVQNRGNVLYLGESGDVVDHLIYENNISNFGQYGPIAGFGEPGTNGAANMFTFTINSSATSNVFYGPGASAFQNPTGNYFETSVANVGWDDVAAGRLELTSGLYRAGQAKQASDGTDMGANVRRTRARVFGRHGLGQGW